MRRSSDTPVTLDHGVLHLNGATHGVDHAAEFDERPVAGALHDAAMIDRDRRIDEIASKRPEPRQRALLVSACESAEPDHIRRQNRREFPVLAHAKPLLPRRVAQPLGQTRPNYTLSPWSVPLYILDQLTIGPEQIARNPRSYTGAYLKPVLARKGAKCSAAE